MINSRMTCVVLFPGMLRCSGRKAQLEQTANDPVYGVQSSCMRSGSAGMQRGFLTLRRGYAPCTHSARKRAPEASNRPRWVL